MTDPLYNGAIEVLSVDYTRLGQVKCIGPLATEKKVNDTVFVIKQHQMKNFTRHLQNRD